MRKNKTNYSIQYRIFIYLNYYFKSNKYRFYVIRILWKTVTDFYSRELKTQLNSLSSLTLLRSCASQTEVGTSKPPNHYKVWVHNTARCKLHYANSSTRWKRSSSSLLFRTLIHSTLSNQVCSVQTPLQLTTI